MRNQQSDNSRSAEHERAPESIVSRMRAKLSKQQRRSRQNGTNERDGDANHLSSTEDEIQKTDTNSQNSENKQKVEELKLKLKFHLSEEEVLETINTVIHKGKNPNTLARDRRGYSVLHMAAERNFLNVAEKLLDYGGDPLSCDPQGNIPLHVAFEKNFDAMAALIISKTKKSIVRRLFGDDSSAVGRDDTTIANKSTANGIGMKSVSNASNTEETTNSDAQTDATENQEREFYKEEDDLDMFDIKTDLIERDLTLSLAAVLDSLAEKYGGLYKVHVKLLEEDNSGQEPWHNGFATKDHTVFHTIAANSREISNHPVMQLLINRKWHSWCRRHFVRNSCLYLLSLFAFTFSIAIGASARSVTMYDTRLDHARAVFEIITYMFALSTLFIEVRQICSHILDYWKQLYNWLELISSFLVVLSLLLRYTHERSHWFVLAVAYLLWVVRIFKYATVFGQTGTYAESLFRILTRDFIQFSLLFLVINLAFGGTFLLVLKGEGSLQTHDESSSYWNIWLLGLRIMVESAPIVDYLGSSGYRTVGSIIFLTFTFVTIVVLMNMLIAQLSNTYTDIQVEAVKTVRANRAWIITRAERNEWKWFQNQLRRVKFYERVYTDIDMRSLKRKDETQLDHINKAIKKIEKKQVKDALQTLTVKYRLGDISNRIINLVDKSHGILLKQADGNGTDIISKVSELETKVDNIENKIDTVENKIDTVTQQLSEMMKLFDSLLVQKSSFE